DIMTKRDLAILGCKILGIFIIASSIPLLVISVPYGIAAYLQGDLLFNSDIAAQIIQVLTSVMMITSGAVFWFRAKRIAQQMVPEDTPRASFPFHENFIAAILIFIATVLLIISTPVFIQYLTS